jgi:hypothetical protein
MMREKSTEQWASYSGCLQGKQHGKFEQNRVLHFDVDLNGKFLVFMLKLTAKNSLSHRLLRITVNGTYVTWIPTAAATTNAAAILTVHGTFGGK